jgi:hypothetical protein
VEGFFEPNGVDKVTFVWNPQNVFKVPIKLTLSANLCPSVELNTELFVSFSVRPSRKGVVNGVPFPFPKDFRTVEGNKVIIEDPPSGIFPNLFLKDMAEHALFNFHIGIGLSENGVFPTLSYSDFSEMSAHNNLNWVSIAAYVFKKYSSLAAQPDANPLFQHFLNSLSKHQGNPSGEKSVLLVPGRWDNFGLREAQALAQVILPQSNFKVFIAVRPTFSPLSGMCMS